MGITPEAIRYHLAHDEYGHTYTIPVGTEAEFARWVEWVAADDEPFEPWTGTNFDALRVDGRLTFTDPQPG